MKTRLLSMGAVAALAAGLLAAPASAAGTARWVDDDGAAGPSGCGGSASAATRVGDALEAASAGDTILVCPGTYKERPTIDIAGVTVRAVRPWTASIAPTSGAGGTIVTVAAKNVTVRGLRIVAPTTGSCSAAENGLRVAGVAGARILANRILANPKGITYGGTCGILSGVAVDAGSRDALVAHNIIRDFIAVGVNVVAAEARVIDNSIQFWHLDVELCPAVDCVAARPAALISPTGVRFLNASGVAALNATSNGPDDTDELLMLSDGIAVESSDGVTVRRNYIRHATTGVSLIGSDGTRIAGNVLVGPFTTEPAAAAARVRPARALATGIFLANSSGNPIRNNHALRYDIGVFLDPDARDNVLEGNDVTGNWDTDCDDRTGTTTADVAILNTWTDNLGNNDSPSGLCTDAPIQAVPGSPT